MSASEPIELLTREYEFENDVVSREYEIEV
jgi:hypothetical protein